MKSTLVTNQKPEKEKQLKKPQKRSSMRGYKIQDYGIGLNGRQEQYWRQHLMPKYQHFRPGFKFKFKTPQQLSKQFEFVAFEFGRYTTQSDRYDFLAAADASFSDMEKVTGIKNLGLKKIGVAYGARGKGGRALAHFEPGSFMINLTKNKGLGSFAHEYGHALDYFFGGFIHQEPSSFALSGGVSIATRNIKKYPAGTLRDLMNKVLDTAIWEKPGKHTKSYERFGKIGSDYWYQRNEIFARVFEHWVHHQLAKKKINNIFLTKRKYEDYRYLVPADFKRVLPHMNRLIKAMAAKTK